RFLFKINMGYPNGEQEVEILSRHNAGLDPHDPVASGVTAVGTAADLARARSEVTDISVDPAILDYIVRIAQASRQHPSLTLGVSPRGTSWILHASKAWAWLAGRTFVTPD